MPGRRLCDMHYWNAALPRAPDLTWYVYRYVSKAYNSHSTASLHVSPCLERTLDGAVFPTEFCLGAACRPALRPLELGIDLAGRRISATASGLLDAHAYLYNGLQALMIGRIPDGTGGNWPVVFLLLAASWVHSAAVVAAVKA
ncbi:MAG TPA: hypothetical protein VLK82_14125 [Candidatus Tectomicrobia bacterium]|nr:hypothetical protein [Candidatus Tectomicrobia bacterium]